MTDNTNMSPEEIAIEDAASRIIAPEQPPMDDAAGGPSVDADDDRMPEPSSQTGKPAARNGA